MSEAAWLCECSGLRRLDAQYVLIAGMRRVLDDPRLL
jgi:hypothetical protein